VTVPVTFRAMDTEVTVCAPALGVAAEAAAGDRVAACFRQAERRFSRFRADSELSRLNRAGAPVVVSEPMFAALIAAHRFVAATGGAFDPGVGAALRAHGYDRSFAPGALDRPAPPATAPSGSLRDVELDPTTRQVRRPAHVQIDLGGLIKGRTADQAAACLPAPAAVDAGGDAVVRGAPDGGWLIDVEDPRDPARTLLTLRLRDQAVATSAGNRRHWRRGGRRLHHIIDPRTGQPAASGLLQVTAVAATAEVAEVLAKAALILGAAGARALLAGWPAAGAVLVDDAGRVAIAGTVELADA
jgi:thiamine biosynthesis lipoprotein